MNEIRNEAKHRFLARADAYRLLAACYYEPDPGYLEEDVFGQLHAALEALSPDGVGAGKDLGARFREAGQEALMLDYSGLFLGPFGILAKPYGSTYLDGERVVMGESTLEALALYRQGGFQVAEAFQEMPDHVAVELEFLYLLNLNLGNAIATAESSGLDGLKRTFLEAHLGRWIGPFTEAMGRGATTDFYRNLAGVTRQVVLEDLQEPRASQP